MSAADTMAPAARSATVQRLLFGGLTADERKGFLYLGRPRRSFEDICDALKDPERDAADMGRRLFRSMLLLEGKAVLQALRGLRQREAERYLGFGHLAQDVHEDELERQHLAAQVEFEVLKGLVARCHGHPPPADLGGMSPEDWYVAHSIERCKAGALR